MAQGEGQDALTPMIIRPDEPEQRATISWPERYAVLLVCAYFGAVTALLWVMDHI